MGQFYHENAFKDSKFFQKLFFKSFFFATKVTALDKMVYIKYPICNFYGDFAIPGGVRQTFPGIAMRPIVPFGMVLSKTGAKPQEAVSFYIDTETDHFVSLGERNLL